VQTYLSYVKHQDNLFAEKTPCGRLGVQFSSAITVCPQIENSLLKISREFLVFKNFYAFSLVAALITKRVATVSTMPIGSTINQLFTKPATI